MSRTPKIRFKNFNDDWEQRKFSELCDMVTVGIANSATHAYSDSGIVMFRNQNIKPNFLDDIDIIHIKPEFESRYKNKRLKKNDLLVARTGYPGTTCVVPEKYENSQTFTTLIARPKNSVNPYFLCQYLNSDIGVKYFESTQIGGGQKNSGAGILNEMPVMLPSGIEEESKIAEYFTNFDHLITLHQRKLDDLKNIKTSMLSKMFPGECENKPRIRFKGFNDDWEQRKLGELGEILTGSTPSTSNSAYYSEDGIPWVTPTDINELTISDTPRKLSEEGVKVGRVVPANTILCTCIASIGKNALLTVKGSFNQQINSLTPSAGNDAYFLLTESELWSNKMKRMAASGTMQIVNKTEFSELDTLVPSTDEQKKIGSYFRNLDNLITLHQRELEKLQNIKKSMLEKMFV